MKKIITAFALGLLCFALGFLNLHNGQTWNGESGANGDFALYLVQGISIAQGSVSDFIKASAFMRAHSYGGDGPIIYPWGYPLLLALGIKAFGLNIFMLKLINLTLMSVFVGGFFMFCMRFVAYRYALLGSLLFACSPYFIHFDNRLLSDVPFLCVGFFASVGMWRFFTPPPH